MIKRLRSTCSISIMACVLAFAFAGCEAKVKPSVSQYLALGDSYTIGESVAPEERWPVQLADALRKKGIDLGAPEIIATTGWTTDELSAGIDAAAPRAPDGGYRLVTLLVGVNNQYRGRSADEFREQFRGLLKRAIGFAGGRASRVIVVSIPDWGATPFGKASGRAERVGAEIDAFNAVCREEATRAGCAFVDITPGSRKVADDPSLVAPDGLHPSGKMYHQWTDAILPEAERAAKP